MHVRKIDIKPQASGIMVQVTEEGKLPHDHAFSAAREVIDFISALLFAHERKGEIAGKSPRRKEDV